MKYNFNNYDDVVMLLNTLNEYIDSLIYYVNTNRNKTDINNFNSYVSTIYQLIDYIKLITNNKYEEENK